MTKLAALLFSTTLASPAFAVDCQDAPGKDGYYAWRYVEPHLDRKCYYKGTKLIPKSELRWVKHSSFNYLKLPRPNRDANGNIVHLSGVVIEVPTKNEIDEAADLPPDVIEDRPFGPWEERIGGQFR